MKWRAGRNLVYVGAAAAILSAGGFAFDGIWPALMALLLPVAGLLVMDVIQLRKAAGDLSAQRVIPAAVGRGRPFRTELVIRNAGNQRLTITGRDVVPPASSPNVRMFSVKLEPSAVSSIDTMLTISQRGHYVFGDAHVRVSGVYGMMEIQLVLPCSGEIKVLPESAAPDQALRKDALDEQRLLDEAVETKRRGEGTEFESLAEFRPGDELRRIDWRTSARTGNLIVRRYQMEQHRDVVILLDCGRLMGLDAGAGTKLDRCIDSALLLARVALANGDRCGLGIFDNRVRGYLPPMRGLSSLRMLTEALYDVASELNESNFAQMFAVLQQRRQKRSFIIILSDVPDPDTTERYRTALAGLTKRHTVLFTAVRTPLLWQTIKAPVTMPEHAAQKAVVFRLLRDREKTLHSMRRSGVNVLDVDPTKITVPLVNQYLALRERAVV